jgi:DNA-binding NtrC family response regulator
VFSARYGWPRRRFDGDSIALLDRYEWPGNVRELENLVHRALLLTSGPGVVVPREWLTGDQLPAESPHLAGDYFALSLMEAKARVLDQFERVYVSRTLAQARGNVSEAARRAGKERRAFGKLLKKYSIDKRMFPTGS